MTFEEWCAGALGPEDIGHKQVARMAWEAAQALEREECAYLAEVTASGRDAEAIAEAIRLRSKT